MNRSFSIAAESANGGPGQRPSQPQTVSPKFVAPPPRDTRSKLSASTSAIDSSHSKLRASNSTSGSMSKNSGRIKKKGRKSTRTGEQGGEASSKSTASPLPPSARDLPLPPKDERAKQQSSLAKAAAMAQQRKSTHGIPAAGAARAGVRRDRSGLSRAQQHRLSSSSPGLNYVHEAQQREQSATTTERRPRRTSVTKRASDVAAKPTTAASARKNSRSPSASDARRQSKQRMAALDRSELSTSRRTLDRSEPSISSMSRSERMARSNPGAGSTRRRMTLMNDRSDPSHNAIGPTRRRRRPTKKSLPTNKPRRSVPEPSDGSNSEAEEDTREKGGEESTVNGSLPDLAPAPPSAPSIAPERKSRKQSVLSTSKPDGGKEKEEKGHWWKSWSRISFRGGENVLDTSRHQEDLRAATESSKNKKKRNSVTSGAQASHLNSIELLQQLVNSDDSATNDDSKQSKDPLAISAAPTFASGVLEEEDPAINKSSMRKTKSAPDLPKQGSGHAATTNKGGNSKRNSTKSDKVAPSTNTTATSKQRKSTAKQRKSKGLRGSGKQYDMENSISNQSLTMSMLGDMDARTARTRRTEKTDPVTGDEASMGLSSSVGFGVSSSMMSSGMMSAMSSLTGNSSRHTFNQSSSTWNNNSSTRSSFHNSRSSAKGGLPQNINVGNNSSVVTKMTRPEQELESVAESEPSNDAPTFAEDSTENSSVDKPQQPPNASRPVKELTSFLNEFDDLDALFTQGLEAVGMEDPIEEGSKETATKYSPEGSPELEDNKTTPSSTPSKPLKKEKRKSRAGDVLKRFMKNFDDLDILFSRKLIKDDNPVNKNNSMESTSRHSKDDIGVGASKKRHKPQKRRSSFSEASSPKEAQTPARRKSHANILTSHPNILKEMLTMSTDDLENLFAKQAEEKLAAEREAAAREAAKNKNESSNPKRDNVPLSLTSIKDRIHRKKLPSGRDELSKISEEPSSAGEHRRSISSFECSLSNTSSLQKSPQPKTVSRASLTLEDLMTPDLEYDSEEDKAAEAAAEEQVKKRDSLMKSENLHEVRRKGTREAVTATQGKLSSSENLGGSRRKSVRGNESSALIHFPVNEPRQKPKLETTKEAVIERVHRTLADRLNSSEGSMSPPADGSPSPTSPKEETEATKDGLQKTTIRSLPEPGSNSELSGSKSTSSGSGKSLPTKLDASAKSKAKVEEPEASTSTTPKPVDVLEILLERYDDYKGVDATKAALTTDLLDIDFDTVKAIKDAKRANPKEDGEKKREREMARRKLARTNSLKREAAREEAAREAAALEQSRLAEQGQQVFGEFFPSLAEQAENSNSALLAPFAEVLQNNMPDLKPYEQGHSSYINKNNSDESGADSPDSGPDLPKFAGPERRHSDTASFASYTVSRASLPNSDNISLPSQIGGPDSAFAPAAGRPGSWADDLSTATSWRNFDDARSVYSERPGGRIDDARSVYSERPGGRIAADDRSVQSEMPRRPSAIYSEMPRRPSSGIGFRQPQPERTNFNRPSPMNSFNRPRSHMSPWVDNSYYGDEYYHGQPNLNQRRNFEFPSAAPTINEFEAQFYRAHPHLLAGMPQSYGMYSSPDFMHYDQGYGLESMRRYHVEELMRSSSHRYPPGGPPRFGSKLDGGRSMSLDDVAMGAGPQGFQRPSNQGLHPMNRNNYPSNGTLQSAGGPSERRLSTSMHGKESEWEDFSDVARSGALQSIPWRSIRGLSYHQRLNETEKERKAASLLLDDSFHWRFHHAVSKGCPNSKNEYSCGPKCCCKKSSPPWYHRPAAGVLASEEKEEDEEPSYKGRTLRSLKLIAKSVEVELKKSGEDDVSLTYPSYDPALDVGEDSSVVSHACDNDSLCSFAG